MKRTKTMCILSVVACAAMIVTPAVAGDQDGLGGNGNNGQGTCSLDGSWLGTAPDFGISFMAEYHSMSHWLGTVDLTWIGGDPTFLNSFPDAVALTETKGQFRRTDRRSFEYTMIWYGVDMNGQPVYIAKNSGWVELGQGCRSADIGGTISLYAPTQDPFGDDPPEFGCVGPAFAYETRMSIDPPCEPPPPPTATPTPPEPTPTPPSP